jgi:hypothetical protein
MDPCRPGQQHLIRMLETCAEGVILGTPMGRRGNSGNT